MDEIIKFNNFDEETERQAYLDEKVIGATIKKYIGGLKPTGATYKKWARHYLTYLESRNIQDAPNTNEEELYFEKNPFEIDLTPENINDFYAAVNTEEQISIFDTDAEKVIATAGEKHLLNKSVRAYIGLMLSDFASCSAFLTAYLLWNSKESGHIVYDAAKDKAIFDILAPFDEVLTKHGYATTERKAAELLINADEDAIPALFAAFEEVQKTVKSTYLINFDVKVLQSLLEFAEKYGGGPEKSRKNEKEETPPLLTSIQNGYGRIITTDAMNAVIDAQAHGGRIKYDEKYGKFILQENNFKISFNKFGFNAPTSFGVFEKKILSIILLSLAREKKGVKSTTFTLDDVCSLLKNDNTPSMRKEICKKINQIKPILMSIGIDYMQDNGTTEKVLFTKGIIDGIGIDRKGIICVDFSDEFVKNLENKFYILIPVSIFGLDGRKDKTAINIGFYMSIQRGLRIKTNNQEIYKVKTLIEKSGLKTIKELKEKGERHYEQLLIQPLERALDTLQENGPLQSWEYCNAKGEILTDEQLNSSSIDIWAEYRIKAIFKDYPQQNLKQIKEEKSKKRNYKKS